MVISSLSPLRARKSDNYRYCDSWNSDNLKKEAIKKRSKELIQKRMQRGLRVITLQVAIEKKSNIAFAILEILMIGWHHNYFVFWW